MNAYTYTVTNKKSDVSFLSSVSAINESEAGIKIKKNFPFDHLYDIEPILLTVSKILVSNKYLLDVNKDDVGVYVVDIPKCSRLISEIINTQPAQP